MEARSQRRILFELIQDEYDYPPSSFERLWGAPLSNGNYRIDSIPFFVMGISPEDEVSVEDNSGELVFKELVRPSSISTFRLSSSDSSKVPEIRLAIEKLGGRTEYNQQFGLIAAEISGSVEIAPFLNYIVEEQEKGVLDFEESALRHRLDD